MWRDRDHAGRRLTRAGALLLATLLSAACAGALDAPAESPPSDPVGGPQGTQQVCLDALLEGTLLPDGGTGFIVRHDEGFVAPVTWPDGYTVRDAEVRELVDPTGRVVAREGDLVTLGGGEFGTPRTFHVCGPFTVTPRD